jgi:hypothetical protein
MFNQLSRTLIGLISVICLTACQQTPNPKPPLTKPIQLDKAGVKESIEFWANPRDSHEKNQLMVGLILKETSLTKDLLIQDRLRVNALTLPIKISLVKIDNMKKTVVFRSFLDTSFDRLSNVSSGLVVYGDIFTYGGDIMLALLDRTEPGFYRVEVEVMQDNPAFKEVKADLFVAYRLYGGK